ncbi:unnamed protein product, partial [Prorocentrum cordatum]
MQLGGWRRLSLGPAPARLARHRCRRALWTPGVGHRQRLDDPHRRPVLTLREGADARLRRGHPWVFPRDVRDPAELGQHPPCLVNLQSSDGEALGQIDAAFFAERLRSCLAYRERLFPEPFYRLAHGEADGLPGLIVDRFGDHAVLQPGAAALDALLWPIADAVEEVLQAKVIIARQDAPGRKRERAPIKREVLKGQYRGPTELRENGVTFCADLLHGQKTGWYFDLRDQRALLAALAPRAPRVLDLYSHAGGFGISLAQYGAEHVVCVDSSEAAVELCRRAAALNSVGSRVHAVQGDAFEFLSSLADVQQQSAPGGSQGHAGRFSDRALREREFDLVIVDPPNLGGDRAHAPKAGNGLPPSGSGVGTCYRR